MEWNAEEERWDPLHHPFTAPAGEFDPDDPGAARALAYDVVWNGQEMGGGSIRIQRRRGCSEQVFAALGIDAEEAEARFGFLLEALRYGAPPHGGIAYGARPHRPAARRRRVDPRRDRLPQDRLRRRPADRRARPRSTSCSCASSASAIHQRKLAGH